MHQDRPRFSTNTSHKAAELAAVALVNESPTAATISISPRFEMKILIFFFNFQNYSEVVDKFKIKLIAFFSRFSKPGLN